MMVHIELCERSDSPVHIGGLIVEDIAAMCVAGAVIDNDNHMVYKNIPTATNNNSALITFETWGFKGVCYKKNWNRKCDTGIIVPQALREGEVGRRKLLIGFPLFYQLFQESDVT